MIEINQSDLIGTGHHRKCYRHPENDKLCIKIVFFGDDAEVNREKKYYQQLIKRNVSWEMVPQYYGDVETNLGLGSVFDLICDENGEVSRTLEYYLSSTEVTEQNYHGILSAMHALKKYLFEQSIITMPLKPKNIVYNKIDSANAKLVVIDNIGNSDFIPICNYSTYFARKKLNRRWHAFEKLLLKSYGNNQALQRMLMSQ